MATEVRPTSSAASERWVLQQSDRRCHLRIVCIPYAGGSAAVYHDWNRHLPKGFATWTLRLPGRDSRFGEPPATDLLSLVDDAAQSLAASLEEPFVVFGHSLGAFIGFELVRRLYDGWGLQASLLGVSARNAPQIPSYRGTIHTLPDDQFIDVLDHQYGAIPPVIRADRQMRDLYLPILRADATMLETYRYVAGAPLRCPISVFGGESDRETDVHGLAAWAELTIGGSHVRLLPGGHFFLDSERERLLSLLSTDIEATLVP